MKASVCSSARSAVFGRSLCPHISRNRASDLLSTPSNVVTRWNGSQANAPSNMARSTTIPLTIGKSRQSRQLSTSSNLRRPEYSPTSFVPVPYVTGMEGGQHHTTDLFSRLLKERVVCCYGPVEDRMASTIIASLLYLESESSEPVNMYIMSPGGSVSAGLAIYDTMQYISAPITTIVMGQAASMGSLLACAGSPGKRYILPHATIMMHQVSSGTQGSSSDIQIAAKEILRLRDQLNGIYKRHLNTEEVVKRRNGRKIEVEEIEKLLDRDYFLSAEAAVELGVVDEVLTSRKVLSVDEKKE